ncbi:MAG TPA: prenyltransferase [Candidatus Limnocylindria bacterium]|nr:prenyltransferase [Candidatus Limnocylindria bacterium]
MTFGQRVANWRYAWTNFNPPPGVEMDGITKWLVVTRAGVFSMTATSGLIGGLLAIGTDPAAVHYGYLALAIVGLVVAHAANNMINDYFDQSEGIDTDAYVRALYAPHPVLSGWLTRPQLRNAILVANLVDFVILVILVWARGPLVAAFALAGLFISVFYVAPPISLKKRGLGEPGVFLTWGPLMIGGTYFVATGTIPGWVWVASLPYAILVTTVLFGKHIDKIVPDAERGIRTLPVILGERQARMVASALMIAFYPIVIGSALVGWIGPWVALVVLAIPRLVAVLRQYSQPKPQSPPEGAAVTWPLWFVGGAFLHTRRAGALLILGLLLNVLVPVTLPWVA